MAETDPRRVCSRCACRAAQDGRRTCRRCRAYAARRKARDRALYVQLLRCRDCGARVGGTRAYCHACRGRYRRRVAAARAAARPTAEPTKERP